MRLSVPEHLENAIGRLMPGLVLASDIRRRNFSRPISWRSGTWNLQSVTRRFRGDVKSTSCLREETLPQVAHGSQTCTRITRRCQRSRLLLHAILSCGLVERACRQSRDYDDKSLIEQFGAEDSGMRIGLVNKLEDVAKSGSQAWKEAMRAGGDSSMIEVRSSGFQYWFDEERAREHARYCRPAWHGGPYGSHVCWRR